MVYITDETLDNGKRIGFRTLAVLGCVSALSLVLGQYPYFYLTVAFIQVCMLPLATRGSILNLPPTS